MFVYLGFLLSTFITDICEAAGSGWDDKHNFRATHPCSERKAVCLHCSQELQVWRLTHEHGQTPFWEALRTGIVSCWLELPIARALRRVHLRGGADAQPDLVRCHVWHGEAVELLNNTGNSAALSLVHITTSPKHRTSRYAPAALFQQKGTALRYKQEQFKKLVCVQSGEHHKTKLTTLEHPNYMDLVWKIVEHSKQHSH